MNPKNLLILLIVLYIANGSWVIARYKVACSVRPFSYTMWLKEADDLTDDDLINHHQMLQCGYWTPAPCRGDLKGRVSSDEEIYRQIYILVKHNCMSKDKEDWRWKRIELTTPFTNKTCPLGTARCDLGETFIQLD